MSFIRVGVAFALFSACTVASAGSIDFETLSEGDVLTNQYSSLGVIVGGSPVIYTAGSLLNEIDFPPHSGSNVLVDVGGPITFTFATPLLSVGGYFTYTTWLTLEAFSPTGALLQIATSSSGANFGGPGSNEFIGFTSTPGNIGSLRVLGDPGGSSFTLDDLTFAPVPEPASFLLLCLPVLLVACVLWRKGSVVNLLCCEDVLKKREANNMFGFRFSPVKSVLLGLTAVVCVYGQTQKAGIVNSLIPSPSLVYLPTGPTKPPVTFVVNVGFSPNLKANSVTLNQVTASGTLVAVAGQMYDDGTHGDVAANDNNFTCQVTITQNTPATLYYRATAAYNGVIARSQSPITSVSVANPSFSKPPDPGTIVTEANHNPFPVNQLVFAVPPGTPQSTVNAIASSVNGKVVGFSSTANLYQLEIPATTIPELNLAITTISSNPSVTNATKNYVGVLASSPVIDDLTNLAILSPGSTAAYDKISAIPAFQYLYDTQARFSGSIFGKTVIGIVDTGVLSSHKEFTAPLVDFGVSAGYAVPSLSDADGHGTGVTGIIGANCVSCAGGLYPLGPPFQMNGILAGVPGNSAGSSAVPYSIEIRSWGGGTFAEANAAIDDLLHLAFPHKVDVVLLAWGWDKELSNGNCPALVTSPGTHTCIPTKDFDDYTTALKAKFPLSTGVTFVVAAGNSGITTNSTLPANLSADSSQTNIITVGGTDLNDVRCGFGSVSGNCAVMSNAGVDIAAPGTIAALGTNSYVPTATSDTAYNNNFQGTSASAALVAGAAALLHSVHANEPLDGPTTRNLLRMTADTIADTGVSTKRLNLSCLVGACLVDVYFLIDSTGSMGGALGGIRASFGNIVTALSNTGINVDFGVGQFRDYPIAPYGNVDDFPYQRVADMAPLTGAFIAPSVEANVQSSINALFATGGADIPEAQLAALYQAATGVGQAPYIAPNMQVNWRTCPGSSHCERIIVIVTDSSFHHGAPYPGPDFPAVKAALSANGIKVIGIQPNDFTSDALQATRDLETVAAPAPVQVDCLGDGTRVIAVGAPLVCLTNQNGTGVDKPLINAILAFVNQL